MRVDSRLNGILTDRSEMLEDILQYERFLRGAHFPGAHANLMITSSILATNSSNSASVHPDSRCNSSQVTFGSPATRKYAEWEDMQDILAEHLEFMIAPAWLLASSHLGAVAS